MKKFAVVIAKLGLAGAVIFGIWFFALTQEPAEEIGEVKEAQADIGWGAFQDGEEFTRAMEDVGLEPRPYDLNGNVMYFANGVTDKTPHEVEKVIQQALLDHGVNSKDYTKEAPVESHLQKTDRTSEGPQGEIKQAFMDNLDTVAPYRESLTSGDVVTTQRSHQFVRMVGVDWTSDPDDVMKEVKETGQSMAEMDPKTIMGGYKFIEARWDQGKGMTDVTAVWSKKGFDARKMDNTAFVKQEPDPNIPSCMGCERDFRFQSLAADEPMRANKWTTLSSPQRTYEFYQRSMTSRGWVESGAQPILNEAAKYIPELDAVQGKVLHLEKKGKSMQIIMVPNDQGGTEIISAERFKDAQNVLAKDD